MNRFTFNLNFLDFALVVALALCVTTPVVAQVGIGTDTPAVGTILHIEDLDGTEKSGILLAKVSLVDLSITDPLPSTIRKGTLVYNTNEDLQRGYFYWTVTKWQRLNATIGSMAKFSNSSTDGTNNLNDPTGVEAAIIGDLSEDPKFLDDPALYIKVDDSTLKVTADGRYQITVNLSMTSATDEAQVDARLRKNGTGTGAYYRSSEMDPNGGATRGSISFTQNPISKSRR